MSTTTPTLDAVRRQEKALAPPALPQVVLVELRKMFDTRSGFWLMSSIVITGLLTMVGTVAFAPDADLTYYTFAKAIGFPMTVVLPIIAILSITGEWSQRTGLTTFTLVPHRGRVLLAKTISSVLVAVASMLFALAVGVVGNLARSGHLPLGCSKDDEKTATTFVTSPSGVRYVITGDKALLEADGTITMLGRGSVSINSGGEKIFPEEVENALKGHPAVFDAVVVGTPDERWGQTVTAVVHLRDDHTVTLEDLQGIAKGELALSLTLAPKGVVRGALLLDFGDQEEAVRKLLDRIGEKIEADGATRTEDEFEDARIVLFRPPHRGTEHSCQPWDRRINCRSKRDRRLPDRPAWPF